MTVSNHSCKCSKILVVDDEAFNIIVMEGLLNEFGITRVDRAYNGREALSKIEQNIQNPLCQTQSMKTLTQKTERNQSESDLTNIQIISHTKYQMILLDNNMPQMTGIETAAKIREWQSRGLISPDVKLVLVTGDEITGTTSKQDSISIMN